MLSLTNADAAYGDVTVFQNVTLSVSRGETLAIVGKSGSGKSTLLALLAGLKSPKRGTATLDGLPIAEGDPRVAVILQQYGLFPWLTALANVELGLKLRRVDALERRRRAQTMLDRVGLSMRYRDFPSQMSGGEQQRIAIARSLVLGPEVLLMDEPFSALDAITREQSQAQLVQLLAGGATMSVIVTHSIDEAVFLGTTIGVLTDAADGGLHLIGNTHRGSPDFRESDEFFERCREVRAVLHAGGAQ